ncbi:unnamed protein product [Lactuca saligna]|uniref:Uncharacterized protein n=1 Tax=Lactuca saligna TaxID=75948 RepID=A0AA36EL03_LACSI|nr:unnamed protein product [Lactuca saligna]
MQAIIAGVEKPKKGGQKGAKKGEKETTDKERPSTAVKPPTKRKAKSNIHNEEEPHVHNEEGESARNDKSTSDHVVTKTHNDFVPSPPPSPKPTTTPITIAPCPPSISSQTQSTSPLSTPLYIDSTVPPMTSGEPVVSVNASNVGAKTSGFQSSHVSPPISPIHRNDPDMIYGDDEDELAGFTHSPFTVRNESDDEAPVTKEENEGNKRQS